MRLHALFLFLLVSRVAAQGDLTLEAGPPEPEADIGDIDDIADIEGESVDPTPTARPPVPASPAPPSPSPAVAVREIPEDVPLPPDEGPTPPPPPARTSPWSGSTAARRAPGATGEAPTRER